MASLRAQARGAQASRVSNVRVSESVARGDARQDGKVDLVVDFAMRHHGLVPALAAIRACVVPPKTASLEDLVITTQPGDDLGPIVHSERTIMDKPDNSLKSDIEEQLDWDQMLDDSQIDVSVKEGQVTLSGGVPTYYEATLAEQDARSVSGVKAVDNDLLVGPIGEDIADADLASRCAAALDAERFVPEGAITLDVQDGHVTLRGDVRHHYERQAAELAVARVKGVRGISNQIAITSQPVPADVADRIKRALRRNAIIDDSRVSVTTDDHTVYLDGEVGSWKAEEEAVDTAWGAPGVTDVVDRLIIVS
jgi:osmotically-inducible protein OsmY